jgi:hypothetical protein
MVFPCINEPCFILGLPSKTGSGISFYCAFKDTAILLCPRAKTTLLSLASLSNVDRDFFSQQGSDSVSFVTIKSSDVFSAIFHLNSIPVFFSLAEKTLKLVIFRFQFLHAKILP